ncbi:MAG: 16S rRNA (uracil(1498)-N(3))-methyltransferase [Deltaproteobacteria bacterium]|nr:16S rRNA (uracil(1498)-N(3))-methyltransferase [Deltaproteobacteria bacterium]
MTTPRIYLPQFLQKGDSCILRGSNLKYVKSVLRMKAGERIFLFDGRGHQCEGVLKRYTDEGALITIVEKQGIHANPVGIHLFQSLPKAGMMDFIVEKATELGVERITPFAAVRSVGKVPQEKIPAKCLRWQKIAQEAARKCGRANIPEVAGIISFDDVLTAPVEDDMKLIFWEEEKTVTLKQIFRQAKTKEAKAFSVIIGPEGGFTAEEVDLAVKHGFTSVSLGNQVLKVDTAVMAALTVIQYEKGIFSGAGEGGKQP